VNDSTSFLAYVSFTFVLVVTPGSTTAVVVRNALEGGRRAGYATAVGAAAANTTIAIACRIGLSVLIEYWPGSLQAFHIGGAVFLAWLGVASLWRAATKPDGAIRISVEGEAKPSRPHLSAYFGDGLAINLLSPVIISFYLSVVPTFIPPGNSTKYFALLASTHVGLALVCHSLWATALDLVRKWFAPPPARRALQALTGTALILLALRVL
jgi:threonine/homoserine/homoserine lactone efflux protein